MNGLFPKLYTEGEASFFLRVRPCTVRNERVRGHLGYILVGRRVFYLHEHLAAYLERQQVAASPTPLVQKQPEPRRQHLDLRPQARRAKDETLKQAALLLAQEKFAKRPRKIGKEAA